MIVHWFLGSLPHPKSARDPGGALLRHSCLQRVHARNACGEPAIGACASLGSRARRGRYLIAVVLSGVATLWSLVIGSGRAFAAEADFQDAPFDEAHWSFQGRDIHPVDALDQKALRLDDGVAMLKDAPSFTTGIITYDVLFSSDSPMYSGLRFHGKDDGQYEYFYLRAERNGMADANQYTPVINGDQGWQIYSGPEFSSEEGYKRIGWNHVEMRIYRDSADVFINGRRSLRIPELKTGYAGGYLALSSSFGPRFPFNQVYYANFRYNVTSIERPIDMPKPVRRDAAGLIRKWQVSDALSTEQVAAIAHGGPSSTLHYRELDVETNGIANLSRVVVKKGSETAAVARFVIDARKNGLRMMRFGYSDAVDIFVGGEPVFSGNAKFLARDSQYLGTVGFHDAVAVKLREGHNEIMFVVKESYGGWAAAAEFVDPDGLSGSALGRP